MWDGLGTALISAVVAAVVAFATTRLSIWLDRKAVSKAADARWVSALLPVVPGIGRGVVLTNMGDKEALDVTVEAVGGGSFEFDPNCKFDRVLPGESIRFVWVTATSGVVRVQWTTHLGKRSEPLEIYAL